MRNTIKNLMWWIYDKRMIGLMKKNVTNMILRFEFRLEIRIMNMLINMNMMQIRIKEYK